MSLTLGLMQSIGDAVSSLICHVDGLQASAAQQRCDFQAVLSAVEEVNAWQSDLVMLDVGGQRFHTSHDTLCTKSDSIFRSMFGGDFLSEQQEDGSTFVDRDPRLFGHVLDFMRHGCAFLLSCHPPRSPLQRELQFYGLSSARDSVPTHGILFDKRAPGMRVSHAGRRYTNCSSTRFLHGQSSVGWYRGKHTLRIRLLTACPALAIGLCTEDVISDEGKVRYNSVVTEKELLFCLEEGTVEYAGRGYTIFDQNCSLQVTYPLCPMRDGIARQQPSR